MHIFQPDNVMMKKKHTQNGLCLIYIDYRPRPTIYRPVADTGGGGGGRGDHPPL